MATKKITKKTEAKCDSEPVKKFRYQSKAAKQKLFIKTFIKNNAMVQTTCEEVGITKKTYYIISCQTLIWYLAIFFSPY